MYLRKKYETETWISYLWGHVTWVSGRRQLTFWWQRRTRGFDDSDMWSLDYTLCKFMAPRLRALAKITHGYPSEMLYGEDTSFEALMAFDALPEEERKRRQDEAFTKWQAILGKMARAMELWVETDMFIEPGTPEEQEWEEGFELFHKYLFGLWD